MAAWRKAELEKIAGADDLHIAPFRDDGMTYGMPTWIWSVVAEHALYVRAYKGQASRWHGAALRQKAGRIVVAGMTKDVTFEPVDGPINDRVDEAYRRKYSGSEYMKPMIGARARSATVKVVPRVAGAARCPMGLRLPPTGSHPSCRAGETVHTDAVSGTRTSARKESQ